GARFGGRADEIGDDGASGLHHAVAHPAHAAGMLDAILMAETEIAREVCPYRIGIEHHRIQKRRKGIGERRLAGAWQTHDEYFLSHFTPTNTKNCPRHMWAKQYWLGGAGVQPQNAARILAISRRWRKSP